jgi:hypothetical protein
MRDEPPRIVGRDAVQALLIKVASDQGPPK